LGKVVVLLNTNITEVYQIKAEKDNQTNPETLCQDCVGLTL